LLEQFCFGLLEGNIAGKQLEVGFLFVFFLRNVFETSFRNPIYMQGAMP